MSTFLFSSAIFGPVFSRRLGRSLGINLLSNEKKICNFNCIYCECGVSHLYDLSDHSIFQDVEKVYADLELSLESFVKEKKAIDSITFAGNGEPTMHPRFHEIVDKVIELRDKYMPKVKIAVLSNATMIGNNKVFDALKKTDYNILKLDSVVPDTIKKLNRPTIKYDLELIFNQLKEFRSRLTIQTLFLKGEYNQVKIDNTTDKEVDAWIEVIKDINPSALMVYTFSRDTAVPGLVRAKSDFLDSIAERTRAMGIETQVSY